MDENSNENSEESPGLTKVSVLGMTELTPSKVKPIPMDKCNFKMEFPENTKKCVILFDWDLSVKDNSIQDSFSIAKDLLKKEDSSNTNASSEKLFEQGLKENQGQVCRGELSKVEKTTCKQGSKVLLLAPLLALAASQATSDNPVTDFLSQTEHLEVIRDALGIQDARFILDTTRIGKTPDVSLDKKMFSRLFESQNEEDIQLGRLMNPIVSLKDKFDPGDDHNQFQPIKQHQVYTMEAKRSQECVIHNFSEVPDLQSINQVISRFELDAFFNKQADKFALLIQSLALGDSMIRSSSVEMKRTQDTSPKEDSSLESFLSLKDVTEEEQCPKKTRNIIIQTDDVDSRQGVDNPQLKQLQTDSLNVEKRKYIRQDVPENEKNCLTFDSYKIAVLL